MKLLIVDDDDDIRETLTEVLTVQGFEVTSTDCIHTAMSVVDSFTVVILDLGLEFDDAMQSVTKIKGLAPGIHIIIYTGYNVDGLKDEAIRIGVDDYVLKGDLTHLFSVLDNIKLT